MRNIFEFELPETTFSELMQFGWRRQLFLILQFISENGWAHIMGNGDSDICCAN